MLYSIDGTVASKKGSYAVVETAGLGLKIFGSQRMLDSLPSIGSPVKLFCHLHVKEDSLELYGFRKEDELRLFELLISVSGVGPRSALVILGLADPESVTAAIKEGRPDLLTRASGIGKKTAERIILELRTKVEAKESEEAIKKMETDSDLVEALANLGYSRNQAKDALSRVAAATVNLEDRLREALKILTNRK